MQNFRRIDSCRICDNTNLVPVLNLGEQSLTGVFPRQRNQRLTRGPLELVKCCGDSRTCGLVQLRHSYRPAEMYGDSYGYRSSLNRSMVGHLHAKVDSLCGHVLLEEGDLVLDIGSNDGTTLSFYPETLTRVGIDPTAARFRQFYKPGVHIIPDFFSAERFEREFGRRKARIVTSIAMFYDLDRPLEFVEEIERVLDDDGIWHLEQSYLPLMLTQTAYDTICHEHVQYYGLRQLEWLMSRSGLKIIDVELNDVNGGSFAVTVSKVASRFRPNTTAIDRVLRDEERAGMATLAPLLRFSERVFAHRDRLVALLDGINREGARILGYGASTKGNVILQFCGITADQLPFIADVNEDKLGCFTPGSGIPIISEADAHAMAPDYLLVLPWHFRQNLIERESGFLHRGGKMIFPLPEIEVVGIS